MCGTPTSPGTGVGRWARPAGSRWEGAEKAHSRVITTCAESICRWRGGTLKVRAGEDHLQGEDDL